MKEKTMQILLSNLAHSIWFWIILSTWLLISILWISRWNKLLYRIRELLQKPIITTKDPEPHSIPLYPRLLLEQFAIKRKGILGQFISGSLILVDMLFRLVYFAISILVWFISTPISLLILLYDNQKKYKLLDKSAEKELYLPEDVYFSATTNSIKNQKTEILVHLYLSDLHDIVRREIHRHMEREEFFSQFIQQPNIPITKGVEILVRPDIPQWVVTPSCARVVFSADVQSVLFEARSRLEKYLSGNIFFYLGPILICQIPVRCGEGRSEGRYRRTPYRKIFVSYSHKDTFVVEQIEKAIASLGDKTLRDVNDLRSGEKWNPRLLELINQADIFQLFWSNNSKQSKHVEQEWRYAVDLEREHFIRPVYWEEPMPPAPNELAHIHFAKIEVY